MGFIFRLTYNLEDKVFLKSFGIDRDDSHDLVSMFIYFTVSI